MMRMGLITRYRYWTILQLVAIVCCLRGKVSSERVQGCVGSRLHLTCPEMKLINIEAVVLGDSKCSGTSCCVNDTDCTHDANDFHTRLVHRYCNNKPSCSIDVHTENIPCRTWVGGLYHEHNDFERITYICRDYPLRSTTATLSKPDSTETILHTEENTPKEETANDDTNSSNDEKNKEKVDKPAAEPQEMTTTWVLPVIMAIVCLLILIAIVVVVVILRRKTWSKGSASIELTDIDYSDRNEAIYANENQTTRTNNGTGSQVYSNVKIKKSKNKDAKASEAYEVSNDVVYSLADSAGPLPREDPIIYCDVEIREPEPRSNVYSVVRDDGEPPECAGSTENASNVDNNVYNDVETGEPAKATNISAYDEACNWKESEYKAVKADKTFPSLHHQHKKMESAAHKTVPVPITNTSHPLTIATTSNSDGRDIFRTSDALPSPSYETMSPGIPEGIYANQPVLSPSWSVASRVLSTGSEAENPYCEMRSPSVSFRDDGSQTVVENDLYSH